MNTEREKKSHQPLTGRRFDSMEAFLAGEAVSAEVRSAVRKLDQETAVVSSMVEARREAGLTQQQMAEKIGKTQGAVSKLESSADMEITLDEIAAYAKAIGMNFAIMIGAPMNHIESVKYHALAIREHLSELAKEAHRNEEVEQAVQRFWGEAFFTILAILGKCQQEMPKGGAQVRMKTIGKSAFAERNDSKSVPAKA
jgi:transcriptional regulator with XRE-family HTH domain